jgi:transposase
MLPMTLDPSQLPDDIAILKAMVIAGGREIEALKLTIAKMRRDKFSASSERGAKLLDQLELQLAELEESVAQDIATAQINAPADSTDKQRLKPARRPLPAHLPRERVVHSAPSSCPGCGGASRKLGEDITETLELGPAQWRVIQHVREKFSCRRCEAITQAPAPSHPIARGRAGPQLARPSSVRQVPRPSAAQPTERYLRQRRCRPRHLDAGRLGRGLCRDADAC